MKTFVRESKYQVGDVVEYKTNYFGRITLVDYTQREGDTEIPLKDGCFSYMIENNWYLEENIKCKLVVVK